MAVSEFTAKARRWVWVNPHRHKIQTITTLVTSQCRGVQSRVNREQQYGRFGQWQVEQIGPLGALGAPRGPISPWVWALWGPRAPLGPAMGPPGPWALFAQPAICQTCRFSVGPLGPGNLLGGPSPAQAHAWPSPDFWKFGNLEAANLEIWDPKKTEK